MSFIRSKNLQDLMLTSSQACQLTVLDLTNSTILKTLIIDRLFRSLTQLLPCAFTSNSPPRCELSNPILVHSEEIVDYPTTASKSWSLTKNIQIPELLPNIRLTHPPTLCFIPLSSTLCPSSPYWLISVELTMNSSLRSMLVEAFLIPHLKNTNSSNCWTVCKTHFNLVQSQEYSLVLFAYSHRHLFHNLAYKTTHIDLYINLVCGSCKYTLKFLDPLLVDFKTLLVSTCSIVNSLWTKRRNLLPCIFPLVKQWILRTTSPTIFVVLESKLGWNRAVDYRDDDGLGRKQWLFTSGILSGTLLDVVSDSESCSIYLEARSHSLLNLELVESVLQQLPDTCVHSHTPNKKNENFEKQIEHLGKLRNFLIEEVECLMELITQTITSTMHKQVPKLPLFLKDISNNLEIAHRLTEWRTLIEGALSVPIGSTESSADYVIRRQLTDDCMQLLC